MGTHLNLKLKLFFTSMSHPIDFIINSFTYSEPLPFLCQIFLLNNFQWIICCYFFLTAALQAFFYLFGYRFLQLLSPAKHLTFLQQNIKLPHFLPTQMFFFSHFSKGPLFPQYLLLWRKSFYISTDQSQFCIFLIIT